MSRPEWMAAPAGPYPLREFERVVCWRLKILTGQGVAGDPVRHVTYWLTEEGEQIARLDPWEEEVRADLIEAAVEA